jgi:hypothetical protein
MFEFRGYMHKERIWLTNVALPKFKVSVRMGFEQHTLQFKRELQITVGVVCLTVILFSFLSSVYDLLGFEWDIAWNKALHTVS